MPDVQVKQEENESKGANANDSVKKVHEVIEDVYFLASFKFRIEVLEVVLGTEVRSLMSDTACIFDQGRYRLGFVVEAFFLLHLDIKVLEFFAKEELVDFILPLLRSCLSFSFKVHLSHEFDSLQLHQLFFKVKRLWG